jgi:hypothetical protein
MGTISQRGLRHIGRVATDCSGQPFGNWRVVDRAGSWQGDATWNCVCEGKKQDGSACGAKAIKPRRSLVKAAENEQEHCRACMPMPVKKAGAK